MSAIAVIYFSGYGHTVLQAEAIAEGARATGTGITIIRIPEDGVIAETDWTVLADADAIIYGSPTYMGAPAWQFKRFADASSKVWMERGWQDKLAGGFTTSASTIGDKGETLNYFKTLAQQHGQLWVSLGQLPSNMIASTPDDANWADGSAGAMALARADAPAERMAKGDRASAMAYGRRIAELAIRLRAVAA